MFFVFLVLRFHFYGRRFFPVMEVDPPSGFTTNTWRQRWNAQFVGPRLVTRINIFPLYSPLGFMFRFNLHAFLYCSKVMLNPYDFLVTLKHLKGCASTVGVGLGKWGL